MDHDSITVRGCLKSGVDRGSWVVAFSSSVWVVGYGSFKSGVGLMSLWVSQVHHGSLKSDGIGWVLNWCGSWRVVVGYGGYVAKDHGGSVCTLWWWTRGDRIFFVIMWWLFLMDVAVVNGF